MKAEHILPLPQLGKGAAPLTMSSREIAELTGKRHDHVMRDIRVMLVELHGENRLPNFGGTVERPNPSGGAPISSPCFNLPKRETMILISGYSIPLRAAIVDRWQELEEAVASPMQRALASRDAAHLSQEMAVIKSHLQALTEIVKPSVPGAYVPGKSPGIILEDAGFTDRPRGLANYFGNCLEKAGIRPAGRDHRNTRLFPQDAANEWLRKSGHTTIARYIAEKRGQNALALPGWDLRHIRRGSREGCGGVFHNGEMVLFDIACTEFHDEDEVVVVFETGEVSIERVVDCRSSNGGWETNRLSPREILSAPRQEEVTRRSGKRTLKVQYAGLVIGKVIDRKPAH